MKKFDRAMTSIVQAFLKKERLNLECNVIFYQPERPVCNRPPQDDETLAIVPRRTMKLVPKNTKSKL